MARRLEGAVALVTGASRFALPKPHGHAFYEVVENATNKLTEQMAEDLHTRGVAVVAVSPGWIRHERMNLTPESAALTESTEFIGRGVAALAVDPGVLRRSGAVFTTPELARDCGFADVDGSVMSPWRREYLES